MQTAMEQRPANGRPRGPCGSWQPASRLGSCPKTYASPVPIVQKHQSGNSSTNREKSTKRWSDSLQVRSGGGAIRPRGWSESPHLPRHQARPRHALKAGSVTRLASSARNFFENPADIRGDGSRGLPVRSRLLRTPPPRISIFGHAYAEGYRVVSVRRCRGDMTYPLCKTCGGVRRLGDRGFR